MAQAARGRIAARPAPWPSWTRTVRRPGSRPSARSASSRGISSARSSEDDRIDHVGLGTPRRPSGPRSPPGPQLARLEHGVEEVAALQRARCRRRIAPEGPAAPDQRGAGRAQRRQEPLVRMGPVEHDDRGLDLGDRGAQPVAGTERPAQVGARARAGRRRRRTRPGNPSSRTTGAAAENVMKNGSSDRPRRPAIAIERVRCPSPVPLEVTNRTRGAPLTPANLRSRALGTGRGLALERATQDRHAADAVALEPIEHLARTRARARAAASGVQAAPPALPVGPPGVHPPAHEVAHPHPGADPGERGQLLDRPLARPADQEVVEAQLEQPLRARSPARLRQSLGSATPTTRGPASGCADRRASAAARRARRRRRARRGRRGRSAPRGRGGRAWAPARSRRSSARRSRSRCPGAGPRR